MKITQTKLEGLILIEPSVFYDARGFFFESWSQEKFHEYGLHVSFVQDNRSFSAIQGTLRGMHFQQGKCAQAKLIYCTRGTILDVAVDLRPDSHTYKQWLSFELTERNKLQLFVPKGFGHGYLTLEDNCEVEYKVDYPYAPKSEGGIIWNDTNIQIEWGIERPLLSDKDLQLPTIDSIPPLNWDS